MTKHTADDITPELIAKLHRRARAQGRTVLMSVCCYAAEGHRESKELVAAFLDRRAPWDRGGAA